MLTTLISIIHVLVALFMILVVLVQGGNSGGMSANLGGGNSTGVFGATGATTILGKMTYGAAILFMCTSLSLSILTSQSGRTGLKEKLATPGATSTDVNGATPAKTEAAAPSGQPQEQKATEPANK